MIMMKNNNKVLSEARIIFALQCLRQGGWCLLLEDFLDGEAKLSVFTAKDKATYRLRKLKKKYPLLTFRLTLIEPTQILSTSIESLLDCEQKQVRK